MNISKRTIRILRTAAGKFFPDDEAYHVWLAAEFGVASTLELTDKQGRRAIAIVDRLKKQQRKRQYGRKRGSLRITFEQKEYIEGLFEALGIPDGPRRWGFIKKQIGKKKSLDWLTLREASTVINGLKKFKESPYNTKTKDS